MSSQASVICFALSIILQMNSSSFEHSISNPMFWILSAILPKMHGYVYPSSTEWSDSNFCLSPCITVREPMTKSDLETKVFVSAYNSQLTLHHRGESGQGPGARTEATEELLTGFSSWVAQLRCRLEPPTSIINQENVLQTAYRESEWRCALSWGFFLQITSLCQVENIATKTKQPTRPLLLSSSYKWLR